MDILSGYMVKSLLAVFAVYLLWSIQKFIRKYQHWRKITSQVSVIGPLHPIWGSLHLFSTVKEIYVILQKITEKERPTIVCYWQMFLFPSFIACHPDSVKALLKSSAPKSNNIGGGYTLLLDWIGEGLLISNGKKWERNRRLLTPGFHFDILKPYVNIYNSSTDLFLANLKPFIGKDKAVDIFPLVTLETLDTILKCAFSYNGNIQTEGANHPYVAAIGRMGKLIPDRWMKPWLHFDRIYYLTKAGKEYKSLCNYIHAFSDRIIEDRKQNLAKEGPPTKRHLDFLDILLTAKDGNGVGLSNEDIRAEVDTFMFEGHDTTSSAISWAIYHLGKHQHEQETVYKEISDLLGDREFITWDDLQTMPKLTAFLKESLRMVPPVPTISRILTSPLTVGDVVLPANMNVAISIETLHHHPDVWPEHNLFKPERFLQEDMVDRNPYSFLPFSAGSRNCIGQHFAMDELKVVVGRFVQRYHVSLVPGHNYETSPELVMRAKNGIKVILEKR